MCRMMPALTGTTAKGNYLMEPLTMFFVLGLVGLLGCSCSIMSASANTVARGAITFEGGVGVENHCQKVMGQQLLLERAWGERLREGW